MMYPSTNHTSDYSSYMHNVSTHPSLSDISEEGNLTLITSACEMPPLPKSDALVKYYCECIVSVFSAIVFLTGVISNGTLITIIIREKDMHHAPNIFIFSIALGDLLFIVVYTPLMIFITGLNTWPLNEIMCRITMATQTFSMALSVFTLTMLSWDRYWAVTKPLHTKSLLSLKRTVITASLIWLVAILFSTLDLITAELKPIPPCNTLHYCGFHFNWYLKFRTLLDFLVLYSLPALAMLTLYSMIARKLLAAEVLPPSLPSPSHSTSLIAGQQQKITTRRRSVHVSVSLAILFIFCFLPRQIYVFWYNYDITDSEFNSGWFVFKVFGFMMVSLKSCINPVAIFLLCAQYRAYFKKYLCCCCFLGGAIQIQT